MLIAQLGVLVYLLVGNYLVKEFQIEFVAGIFGRVSVEFLFGKVRYKQHVRAFLYLVHELVDRLKHLFGRSVRHK